MVNADTRVHEISKLFDRSTGAVVVQGLAGGDAIITKSDLIQVLSTVKQEA